MMKNKKRKKMKDEMFEKIVIEDILSILKSLKRNGTIFNGFKFPDTPVIKQRWKK